MNTWAKEQLEEMFGDDVVEQLAFLAGCTKHSYSDPKNPELDGFIISQATLDKFAELIVRECVTVADYSNVNGKSIIGVRIKNHFGVEE